MVVLVDLEEDGLPAYLAPHTLTASIPDVKPLLHDLLASTNNEHARTAGERPNPNINGFSAALSCYPIVRQLAGQLDLNTLHDLSRTCRQFRVNLLEYRDQLVKHTLHCCYEDDDTDSQLQARFRERPGSIQSSRHMTSGKIGKCARDMVGECQRCAAVVCRNCTMKPPPTPALRARHRRICRTCIKSPLPLLMAAIKRRTSSSGSSPSPSPPSSPNLRPVLCESGAPRAFTAPAFERTPCNCDNVVWLCAPCGKDLKSADTNYVRGWSWRTRYSHYLGGVGTGAGEGEQGVECGRGAECLGARIVEHEACEAETLAALAARDRRHNTPDSPERWRGTSYLVQEMEGIGGVLKVKHKKHTRVGECVKMYEDEREKSIQWLPKENAGKLRSWCSWCQRVVPGEKDKADPAGLHRVRSSTSSASSNASR
ncbi:uncharacterized protein EKO05_0010264 [Ascochyta rabiei]|uniref:Uncharacterized protein n=1 Tax=Didymella rabiei TaxID=5454 RepID=A0A163F168_DIDRA|nr:uncharacterized protein EKO05_0010264 [Ascochyta rabiei]KZM24073.1 hypothetical protein ST47_g4751 [Ascochyta rabiei]UPX20018.1 hypothetical protein EKO05_0010264 [Ascochyta rabiei]